MKATEFKIVLNMIEQGETSSLSINDNGRDVIRRFIPKERLILLGGGHVSLALCQMASMLDYSITVVDDRPEFSFPSRFPWADQVICDSFDRAIRHLKIRESDSVCVLTRGHRWDQECLETIFEGIMPHYLGMIGSKRRVNGLREHLSEIGIEDSKIALLHAPIGLPIGGQTPAEIAVSICAELIACRSRESDCTDNRLSAENTDLEMLRFLALSVKPRAFAVVLSVSGSAPVRDGAMMSVDAEGNILGTIGGGCGEAAAISKARRLIRSGESCIMELDMTNEVAADNGLVCGGVMRILIEPVTD